MQHLRDGGRDREFADVNICDDQVLCTTHSRWDNNGLQLLCNQLFGSRWVTLIVFLHWFSRLPWTHPVCLLLFQWPVPDLLTQNFNLLIVVDASFTAPNAGPSCNAPAVWRRNLDLCDIIDTHIQWPLVKSISDSGQSAMPLP